jgi:hypothetical protein
MTPNTPFWKGKLYRHCAVQGVDGFTPPERRSSAYGCVNVFRLEALPFADDIELALIVAPQAESDLRGWQEAWDRSFPSWWREPASTSVLAMRTDVPVEPDFELETLQSIENFLNGSGCSSPAVEAFRIESRTPSVPRPSAKQASAQVLVARTLRAASAFAAFGRLTPFVSAVHVVIEGRDVATVALAGHDEDGTSRLVRRVPHYGEAEIADPRFDVHLDKLFTKIAEEVRPSPAYWQWEFLRGHLGRTVFGVVPTTIEMLDGEVDPHRAEERKTEIAGAIADMAAQGFRNAMVHPREINGAKNPLSIALSEIKSIAEARRALDAFGRLPLAMTVEPNDGYASVNRYFFHGSAMLGSSCVDPSAHPYDGECSKGFDRRLSVGASALIEDGDFNVIDAQGHADHDDYARSVGKLLSDYGVLDFTLDIGMLAKNSDKEPVDNGFQVISVNDLWSSQTFSFDIRFLVERLREDAAVFERKLETALSKIDRHSRFNRLAPAFRNVVNAYGTAAMTARLIARSRAACADCWDAPTVGEALEEAVVHFIRKADDDFTPEEQAEAEDQVSFLQYDGFWEWLWRK